MTSKQFDRRIDQLERSFNHVRRDDAPSEPFDVDAYAVEFERFYADWDPVELEQAFRAAEGSPRNDPQ